MSKSKALFTRGTFASHRGQERPAS